MGLRARLLLAAVSVTALSLPAQAQTPHLIPLPRVYTAKGDVPVASVTVLCNACDSDDLFAAADLRQTLADRHIPTGSALTISLKRDPSFAAPMHDEGYTVTYAPGNLTLTGATPEGVFYAAQTAKQMIEGATLHAADIRDWPAMKYRGLHDDLSRGPVDTLEFQKKIVRTLAAYKANLYSPYFEHTQQYASNPLPAPPGGSISAADARELVAYAKQFHVTIVPEQEAFGHLHHALIYEQYANVAETPHGAVLAPGQPGSIPIITNMFGELAQLYPSPFLHIGADETGDLGVGRTKSAVNSQGLGPVYLDFMQRIDTALRPLNRRLLFWGDIAQHSPDLLKAMPPQFKKDTIAIAWEYNPNPKGFMSYLHPFTDAGFETWVAPGINNWSRVYPNYNNGLANIQQFTRDGQAIGATGQLNTIWYDDGEALASNNWYGILFGTAAAWQPGESSIPAFQSSYAQTFHGDLTGKLNEAEREIMLAHALLRTVKVGDGSDLLFWLDPLSKDGQHYAPMIHPILPEVRLHAERAMQLIAEARAASPATTNTPVVYSMTNMLPSNPTGLRETDAIDALELGARRLDLIGLKFQLVEEMPEIYARVQSDLRSTDKTVRARRYEDFAEVNGVNGRIQDIKDAYSTLRDLYSQLWLRTNRPYALRPVLEHYDYTIGIWISRMDKIRSAQRQMDQTDSIPSWSDLGFPTPAPVPAQ